MFYFKIFWFRNFTLSRIDAEQMEMVLNAEKNPLRLHFPPVIFRLNGSTPLRVGWAGSNAGSEYYYSEEKYIFLLDASSAQKKMIGLSADRINGPFVRSTRGKKNNRVRTNGWTGRLVASRLLSAGRRYVGNEWSRYLPRLHRHVLSVISCSKMSINDVGCADGETNLRVPATSTTLHLLRFHQGMVISQYEFVALRAHPSSGYKSTCKSSVKHTFVKWIQSQSRLERLMPSFVASKVAHYLLIYLNRSLTYCNRSVNNRYKIIIDKQTRRSVALWASLFLRINPG